MKVTMKQFLVTLFFIGVTHFTQAQEVNAKPEAWKEIMRKPLIVEIPDSAIMAKKNTASQFPQQNFGDLLQNAIEEHWKINDKIEFKTPRELKKMIERGETKFAYLYVTKHPDSKDTEPLWLLNYTSVEREGLGKLDYSALLPYVHNRKVKEYYEFDLAFTLNLMQENIKYNQKFDAKLNAADYMFLEVAKNCLKLKALSVIYDLNDLDMQVDDKVLRKSFKKQRYAEFSASEVNQNYNTIKDSSAILLVYPREFVSYNSSAFKEKFASFQRVIFSASDFKILAAVGNKRNDNQLPKTNADDILFISTSCQTKK
jgi:hypothetical protein